MRKHQNISIRAAQERSLCFDLHYPEGQGERLAPLLIFAHGFKGFKDWGHWAALAEAYCAAGYAFLRFNYSHNGVVAPNYEEFSDLEAFGANTFSKELQDIDALLKYIQKYGDIVDLKRICLIGHSRSGPIVLLSALRKKQIRAVMTWASVAELDYAWAGNAELLRNWKEQALRFVYNGRSKQNMPLAYSLYEDFVEHEAEYRLRGNIEELEQPCCIIHGEQDPAIASSAADYLQELCPRAQKIIIPQADHVFGGRHPWPAGQELPHASKELLAQSIAWLNKELLDIEQ